MHSPHHSLCNDCQANILTLRLTSGYYGGEDRARPHGGKCDHGGPFDSGSTGPATSFDYGINKDSPDCLWSPRSHLHFAAASLAQQASEQFIKDFLNSGALTLDDMRLLLGAGPTLASAIDTTGSMGPIIEQVKNRAIAIVDERLGTDEEPSKFVLSPFNDPNVGPTLVTDNASEFKNAIRALGASGGGDCPELAYAGMLQAIAATDRGGELFVFTDASPKDTGRASQVASLASSREIQINPFIFGSCFSFRSGQEESESRWWAMPAVSGLTTKAFGDDFRDVADSTGGQLFNLDASEAGQITTLADLVVRSNVVEIASYSGTLSGSRTLVVPVDASLGKVTFSVSGSSLTVRRPNGATVLGSDPDAQRVVVSGGQLISVRNPQPGNWSAVINGSGLYSLDVSGEGSLDLRSVDFVEATGRPGHGGFAPITGLPLTGTNQVAVALEGDFNSVAFELRRADGTKVADLALTQGFGQLDNERSGPVNLPNESVVFVARGTDGSGFAFERVVPAPTRPNRLS